MCWKRVERPDRGVLGWWKKLGASKGVERELVRKLVRLEYGGEGTEMGKGEVEGWLKVKREEMQAFLKKGGCSRVRIGGEEKGSRGECYLLRYVCTYL